jgi:signal transduction histidine kinase
MWVVHLTIDESGGDLVGHPTLRGAPCDVRLETDIAVRRAADATGRALRYGRTVNWFARQAGRLRSADPLAVDGAFAGLSLVLGLATVFSQDLDDDMVSPGVLAVLTTIAVSAPVTFRRRAPLLAVTIASAAIALHVGANYPEGSLPATLMFLTYTVAAWSPTRRAVAGLAVVVATLVVLIATDTPGLDLLGMVGNIAIFSVAWAIGIALRARRENLELRVREAEERADLERQRAARLLAEERLRIAQELHDVVAHSMSVIAVQAGVGAHVLDARPDQARVALEAISATSRGTLAEMRRLLGVLRDSDGERAHAPAPGLGDLPRLVDDVRAAGVPVTLDVDGASTCVNAGVELSAYRVVQEALTNVIKHAGTPSRVTVTVRHLPGSLSVEVVDDGRGAAVAGPNGFSGDGSPADDGAREPGHGLIGMRERVELWGGELSVGPVTGGGYRVAALLPYGDTA